MIAVLLAFMMLALAATYAVIPWLPQHRALPAADTESQWRAERELEIATMHFYVRQLAHVRWLAQQGLHSEAAACLGHARRTASMKAISR